jgi:orotidine-5'-phosphate decarboxylase
MTRKELFEQIIKKKSFLCVGLDSDINRLPVHLRKEEDPVFQFNRQIVDATAKYAVAYKPNIAFYESMGPDGWIALQRTVDYIRDNYPGLFLIADAKRGDIGNTSEMYARTFLKDKKPGMGFDAVTVNPYMGADSVTPFLGDKGKWAVILALTSNPGSEDFQMILDRDGNLMLYESVLRKSIKWGNEENLMFVVGATRAEMLSEIRKFIPDHFILVPGVGAQGGSLEEVVEHGINDQVGLIVNSSRGIIYADPTEQFAKTAALKASELQLEMEKYLILKGIL